MTCIVGIAHDDGHVTLGGDRSASNQQVMYDAGVSKVFRNGPFIMGYTGSFRFGQVMQYQFMAPPHARGREDMEYLCTDFTYAMRAHLKNAGITDITNGVETSKGTALIGYNGNLYEMDWDFHMRPQKKAAIGSGFLPSIGVLRYIEKYDAELAPEEQVRRAVEVAAHTTPFVREPIDLIRIEPGIMADAPPSPPRAKIFGIPLPRLPAR